MVPTIVGSVYGMNLRSCPSSWEFGYPAALLLMPVCSLPTGFFKKNRLAVHKTALAGPLNAYAAQGIHICLMRARSYWRASRGGNRGSHANFVQIAFGSVEHGGESFGSAASPQGQKLNHRSSIAWERLAAWR